MVNKRKKLQDLTIKDNFMFAAVMLEGDNAKKLLELTLDIEIDHVDVYYEKSIVYNPEYKGVRLDVFVKDRKGTHFNVEMQVTSQSIEKRARYYHSQIDMELLVKGADYDDLPDSYVIFICDFDPLKLRKYKYTIYQKLEEDLSFDYTDGCRTVMLSTYGTNEEDVPEALVKFLKYVAAGPELSNIDYDDGFIKQLQNSVEKIKKSRDMEGRYMLLEEMMKNEYKAGREDGIIETYIDSILQILNARFSVSDELSERIRAIEDKDVLSALILSAVLKSSVEEFESELNKLVSDQVVSTNIN